MPFEIMGMTFTSQGHLAVSEWEGKQAVVYTTTFTHLYNITLPGVISLMDVTSKGSTLFFSDWLGQCIHVVSDAGSYRHSFTYSFWPSGVDIYNQYLYIADYYFNSVYRVTLDGTDQEVSRDQLFVDPPWKPIFVKFDIYKENIIVSNYATGDLYVNTVSGTTLWNCSSSCQLIQPVGMAVDLWGRVIVADAGRRCLVMLSQDGQCRMNLVCDLGGEPRALLKQDNKLYISLMAPSALTVIEIRYT